ncbi:hypothetical protein [Dyella nitratireducens]|uniref:hypothetical protein n=1 Tax=Dyella nitratireducens TaxID=1849580 RepID=UPI001E62D6CF|nr:hypothetical protein [Dyella nitratireducens]
MATKSMDLCQRRSWHSLRHLCMPLCVFMLGVGSIPAAVAGTASAQVTVNTGKVLSSVSLYALGVNTAVWDGHLQDAGVANLLRTDGVGVMRYPGGSTADNFHWQSNTLDDSGSNAGSTAFDQFMQVAQQVGASPIITVNYGSGSPAEAAAWVKYANITKHYNIHYWEIGNELYGNGTYGSSWERDLHAQKGPAAYASNALQFIQAMKAVDPSIQVGLVLTAPGNWPDGQTSGSSPQPWNDTVLQTACSSADFVSIHWYPQGPWGESDAGLLTAPRDGESTSVSSTPSIPSMVSTLHSKLSQYCGAHASSVRIMTTESNAVSYNPGKQTTSLVNALYLAEDYMTWLANGVINVDWWTTHNSEATGNNNGANLYGTNNYGDYGLLSDGGSNEPSVNTPFPAYYGLQIVGKVVGPHDHIVAASSNQGLVQVHAVKKLNGSVAVLLVNTDPSSTYNVSITGVPGGFTTASIYTYGENSAAVGVAQASASKAATQAVAPYSLTAVVFH